MKIKSKIDIRFKSFVVLKAILFTGARFFEAEANFAAYFRANATVILIHFNVFQDFVIPNSLKISRNQLLENLSFSFKIY